MHIAVLGTGNMGKAIISGLLKKYGTDVTIFAHDLKHEALFGLPKDVAVSVCEEWFAGNTYPDAVVIAVKPQDMEAALSTFLESSNAYPKTLWCSIAAGTSISTLERMLGKNTRICRLMPNTPALIGEGMSAYSLNKKCSGTDDETVRYIFSSCGKVVNVKEEMMDVVTGLSGSGPAYVYLFIEALIESGVSAGLSYDVSRQLAVQTVKGASRMVEEMDEKPAELKAKVMSPGGTTVKGLMALERNNFKYAVMQAVAEATERSIELSR